VKSNPEAASNSDLDLEPQILTGNSHRTRTNFRVAVNEPDVNRAKYTP
jgi:hypothetical protein